MDRPKQPLVRGPGTAEPRAYQWQRDLRKDSTSQCAGEPQSGGIPFGLAYLLLWAPGCVSLLFVIPRLYLLAYCIISYYNRCV
jgi:hypothetical protein